MGGRHRRKRSGGDGAERGGPAAVAGFGASAAEAVAEAGAAAAEAAELLAAGRPAWDFRPVGVAESEWWRPEPGPVRLSAAALVPVPLPGPADPLPRWPGDPGPPWQPDGDGGWVLNLSVSLRPARE